ncbi:hypothetical protein NFI96_005504 [Prochilodus magdalenae]|nr:hypothetical protein NFI96_005504 [Prochilodus magdalenae]
MAACARSSLVLRALAALLLLLLLVSVAAGGDALAPGGGGNRRHARSYEHLRGDTRHRKLFNFQRMFLRIDANGKVNGTRSRDDPHNPAITTLRFKALNSILEITSVDVGVVAIRGLRSNYYLAINKRGRVYGERVYGMNCRLKERIQENGYNTYSSARWRNNRKSMFVGLTANGQAMQAKNTNKKNTATHFLPMLV